MSTTPSIASPSNEPPTPIASQSTGPTPPIALSMPPPSMVPPEIACQLTVPQSVALPSMVTFNDENFKVGGLHQNTHNNQMELLIELGWIWRKTETGCNKQSLIYANSSLINE